MLIWVSKFCMDHVCKVYIYYPSTYDCEINWSNNDLIIIYGGIIDPVAKSNTMSIHLNEKQ